MNTLSIILIGVAIVAMLGTVGVLLIHRRHEKCREAAEDAIGIAAQEYFAHFKIRARTIGALLPNGNMMLMVETPPHKKLRFSYIIEPPIKDFIRVQTGVEVSRIFWRFPVAQKQTQVAEVNYADHDTILLNEQQTQPADENVVAPKQPEETETDDYFHQHQTYDIEEVSWDDYSTVTQAPAVETKDEAPPRQKK